MITPTPGGSPHTEPEIGEAHALAILDATLDAVITMDHLGRVVEFNRAAEEIFGYRREDVLGAELAELVVPPAQRAAHRRALERWSAEPPEPGAGRLLGRRIEVEALRADGSSFPAELAICRVDVPGPPVFTAALRDLSDRKEAEGRLQSAEQRYRRLVEDLPLVTYVDAPDGSGTGALYISPQVEQLLGQTAAEWLAEGLYVSCLHPDDRECVLAARREAYEQGRPLRLEYRLVHADGRVVWVEDRAVLVVPEDGGAPFRQGFAIDITERKLAEEAGARAEARYRALVEQIPLVVYVDRLDGESSNLYSSPQIEEMLGYSVQEWEHRKSLFAEILHPDDRDWVLAAHARAQETSEPLRLEYRLRARNGRYIYVHDEARIVIDPDDGEPVLHGYLLDVTARREAEELLRYQAFHDPLTGLANRALFRDRIDHALVLQSTGGGVAVLFVDLDDFKAVNDTLGHLVGDGLLRSVGERLRAALPPAYTVARLGGDEFAVLIERDQHDTAEAVEAADRILFALREPFQVDGREVFVSASVGITLGDDATELLRTADVAMYRAKAAGKAQHAVYVPSMDDGLHDKVQIVAGLRRASSGDEFLVHYQPIVRLATGEVVATEALVRWQHPEQGLLSPAAFISVAEETGAIVDIGRRVLRTACADTARWAEQLAGTQLGLGVNVSPRQLWHPGFVDDVRAALDDSGLDPRLLSLEITESAVVRGHDEAMRILRELDDLGVLVGLDDFGTGYSSLSMLRDLPVHFLKIDRAFVSGIDTQPAQRASVKAVLELAGALGLDVVAEGVETFGQAAELRGLGCRQAQGFYFAPPLPAALLLELLIASYARPGVVNGRLVAVAQPG